MAWIRCVFPSPTPPYTNRGLYEVGWPATWRPAARASWFALPATNVAKVNPGLRLACSPRRAGAGTGAPWGAVTVGDVMSYRSTVSATAKASRSGRPTATVASSSMRPAKRSLTHCHRHRVLLLCDEIQTGMGRTGKFLACEHEGVKPDGVMLGKALGGGMLPVSAFVATNDVMRVFEPGDHGSTFGGNALGAAVALEGLAVLFDEKLIERS